MSPPVAAAREALEPVLGGRYRLIRRIATGGMGTVFEAEDLSLHRRVAVKVLREEMVHDARVRRRFQHEALLAAAVRHRGVAQIHDFVVDPAADAAGHDRAFLVMELVDGEPLSTQLRREPHLPVDRALDIVMQCADALAAAHRCGVVHRDVKPGNILVGEDGRVTLTDFGVATSADPRLDLTAEHGLTYATPSHMSPEQATGGTVGPPSDVYSLGVVAHELLTGAPLFPAATPAALAFAHVHTLPPPLPEAVPRHVREAVGAALAKDPQDRPRDAEEFARLLRGASRATDRTMALSVPLAVAGGTAGGAATDATVPGHRRRGTLAGVASMLLAGLLMVAVLVAGAGQGPDPVTGDQPTTTDATTANGATVVPSGSAVTSAAPTVVLTVAPTTEPPPATVAPAPPPAGGKGHGKGKGKGKG